MIRVIISMYFALTTLSTVGLGDYYPKTNIERIIGSFVLLVGVMCFSFIMGNMKKMMMAFENMDVEFIKEEEELE